jgi:hypothetical protein
MGVLSTEGDREHSLEIGKYTLDENASAFLDGNKLYLNEELIEGARPEAGPFFWAIQSLVDQASQQNKR